MHVHPDRGGVHEQVDASRADGSFVAVNGWSRPPPPGSATRAAARSGWRFQTSTRGRARLEQRVHHGARGAARAEHQRAHARRRFRRALAQRGEEALPRRCCRPRSRRRAKVSVLAAPMARATALRLSATSSAASLCGIVTFAPREAGSRAALAHDLGEALRPTSSSLVVPVEAQLPERRVVHRGRAAVRDRVAEHGELASRSRQFVGRLAAGRLAGLVVALLRRARTRATVERRRARRTCRA